MIGMGAGIALGQDMANKLSTKASIDKNVPPPLPTRNETMYHIAIGETQKGPYDIRMIQEYIANGTITKSTLVWTEGQDDWAEAETVLAQYFKATPPPLPRQN